MISAAEGWRRQLEAWALPPELLAAVPQSPYGFPEDLWRRRTHHAEAEEAAPTTRRVMQLAGANGSVLDVGAGTGRASLPLARAGHPVMAVERNESMLRGLRDFTKELPVTVVEGSWPEVAGEVGPVAVAMCAHVVYDVPDLEPFLTALHERARRAVVVELTAAHPWVHLGTYYWALHQLKRPSGPTVEDFVGVVAEVVGVEPEVERWTRPPHLWFESREEIFSLYGRRLLVGRERWAELEGLLGPAITESEGRFGFGADERRFATVWWER